MVDTNTKTTEDIAAEIEQARQEEIEITQLVAQRVADTLFSPKQSGGVRIITKLAGEFENGLRNRVTTLKAELEELEEIISLLDIVKANPDEFKAALKAGIGKAGTK